MWAYLAFLAFETMSGGLDGPCVLHGGQTRASLKNGYQHCSLQRCSQNIYCLVKTVWGYGVKVCDICEGGMFGCGIGVQWHICRGGGVYLGVSTPSYHDLLRFAIQQQSCMTMWSKAFIRFPGLRCKDQSQPNPPDNLKSTSRAGTSNPSKCFNCDCHHHARFPP